jgi:hypothetical protein
MTSHFTKLAWTPENTPSELQTALRLLAEDYPIVENGTGIPVRFTPNHTRQNFSRMRLKGDAIEIEYSGLSMALRALANLGGGAEHSETHEEECSFETRGIMLDCSRNAVMNLPHFKLWLRRLAMLGCNLAMLYTEDTYQLPGEPYFGYQRGAYSEAELKELDEYAFSLGIELIPCIQTLGHLERMLQWPAYAELRENANVLLVDHDKTYELIAKMLDLCTRVFRTNRIHIGMDETHGLGRGRFMDKFGYENPFDIFNRHLNKVMELCRQRNQKPMIWSDMYFRLGSKNNGYYDRECDIPQNVIAEIPRDVQLVYWDYYNRDEDFYRDWIGKHEQISGTPLMGSGVWTWRKLWYDPEITEATVRPCIAACQKSGVKELFFTLWGDDGAFCDIDSAFAGLTWSLELAVHGEIRVADLLRRYRAVFGADYQFDLLAAKINETLNPFSVLADDPLLATYLQDEKAKDAAALRTATAAYADLARQLEAFPAGASGGDQRHACLLAKTLAAKVDLTEQLIEAYKTRDRDLLARVRQMVPETAALIRDLMESMRRIWLARNKRAGLEVIQLRLGGQLARYDELARLLDEYLGGRGDVIPELEENLPQAPGLGVSGGFRNLATPCIF